jgi:hypothetical protein
MSTRPWLILVGGFLGAGKSSLLLAAGARLRERGMRVALLTNDQADGLVDTRTARQAGYAAGEVAGACFCCSYSKFVETAAALAAQGAEVILAEPVGSCTDIAATVLKPLLADHARLFHLAPYTVLVDAEQFRAMHAADAGAELAWLYAQQLAEADLLVQSKCDAAAGGLDDVPLVHRLSARTGLGVEEWIELVLSGNVAPASHVLPKLDYARYARAEALMAWLNLSATLTPDEPAGPAQIVGPLFDELDARLSAGGMALAHMKAWAESPQAWLRLSLTQSGAEPVVEGDLLAAPVRELRVTLNLRAQGDAAEMERIVRAVLADSPARTAIDRLQCFQPAPPRPERLMR